MPAPIPVTFAQAFAENADPAYKVSPLPDTTADPARASLALGFPPQTMQPVVAGGTPPYGQDMNGILYMISSHTVYQQSGEPYKYNATLAGTLGGYAVGTILGMADGSGLWINRTANNAADPDANGDGWVPVYSYGATTLAGLTGGSVTLTRTQARKKLLILQGTLVANLQVNVPTLPGVAGDKYQEWLVVNATSGNFTVTVKTLSGTGVTVPPGGNAAPVGVYSDGVNVYPLVAPVNLPIDQAATPLTIVQRTNGGYVLATYFNQSSGLENLAAAAIYFDIGDGFHRKIAPVNLAAQMSLSWFSGQVTAGQVPFSAVQQYAAALFTSPAFSGVPTAPTAAVGTSNSQIATTQFANPGQSQAGNGFVTLPGGVKLQWGTVGPLGAGGATTVVFPSGFSSACYSVVMTGANTGGTAQAESTITNVTASTFVANNGASTSRTFRWFAVGV